MFLIADLAPTDASVTEYDQAHFLTYARVLDADRNGLDWATGLKTILYRDFGDDFHAGKSCWDSHVSRAEWIVGDGLALIVQNSPIPNHLIH